jgi:IS30 family transposase
VEDRAIPGQWEGDLLRGSGNSHIATLVYFCDPQSPWQRGSNENTNGLLRQYFPKNTDLTEYSQSDLNKVALRKSTPTTNFGFSDSAG